MGLDITLHRIYKNAPNRLPDDVNWVNINTFRDGLIAEEYVFDGKSLKGNYIIISEELSYQKNGVNPNFSERYNSQDLIFSQADIYELYENHILEHKKESFKEYFLNKFVEGRHVVKIDY